MSLKFKIITTILVIAVLISAGSYFVYQKYYFPLLLENNLQSPDEKSVEITKPESGKLAGEVKEIQETLLKGYKPYKNIEFGFEIQYPDYWTVTEKLEENVRGEKVKEFFFISPNSDLRFAVLPRDGLSYGLGAKGTSTPVFIGGFSGMQVQYVLKDNRRLWLLFPRYGLSNWLEDLGRLDIMTSIENTENDTQIFEKMLNSF